IQKKADLFESQYNNIKKEFKDFIETSRKNEEIKKKELKTDSAKKMLSVADSLSRMSLTDENCSCEIVKNYGDNLQKNIDVIYQQLLLSSGLTPVDPAPGDTFDDTRHMAVGLEYGSRYPEDTVFKVIRKGYLSENMVIRPAEVIISKRPYKPIKVKKTGIWNNFTRWLSPSKRRFAIIDQQMDELRQAQSQKNLILQQEMEGLQEFIAQSGAERQKMDELCQLQGEKIEQLEHEIESLHDLLTEADAGDQKTGTFEQVLNEKTGELEREIIALKNRVMHEIGDKQKIREIEHLCYEMMNQFEQKFSAPVTKTSPMGEDNPNKEPALRKELAGTYEEIPVRNHKIIKLWSEDQKTVDDKPIRDKVARKDQTDEDDESVFYNDTTEDQKTDDEQYLYEDASEDQKTDDEPVMNNNTNDDYKKY
ncbi:MAG: nucleotide exchange factor GrpE, partial [Methanoregula sp.]|nr:nucleotide exchange factor GrpE [Methanoregula sp.]